MRKKHHAAVIILTILSVLMFIGRSMAQTNPIMPIVKSQPFIVSFTINDNFVFTTSNTVTLTHRIIGPITHYRAGEYPHFDDNPQWQPYTTPIKFILSNEYGPKTVYFQVMNKTDDREFYSNIKSDTIDFVKVQIPPDEIFEPPIIKIDPKISQLNIQIDDVILSNVYTMKISYELKVGDVPNNLTNINDLKIDLSVMERPYLYVDFIEDTTILNQEISYVRALQRGTYRGQITFYVENIAPDDLIICRDDFEGISTVTIKAEIRLPEDFSDASQSNNSKIQRIRWKRKPITNGMSVDKCDSMFGYKDDFRFSLGSLPRFTSVGCSVIDLHDCGEVTEPDNSISCDRDPDNPVFGTRSVSWVTKPTNEDMSGKVHWWCEGFANPKPEGNVATVCSNNDGLVNCHGWPKFVFNVYTYVYEPYIVP